MHQSRVSGLISCLKGSKMKPANFSPKTLKALREFRLVPPPDETLKPPEDSELLTPSEIASLRKDMEESVQLMDELFLDEKRG
jgi:hypothetical protein